MAHAQKPGLVFQRNGRVHLNRRGHQFSRLLAAEVRASAVVMLVMLDTPCSEVECKTTGYPLHSHVSPSLPLPCVTVCHHISTELYLYNNLQSIISKTTTITFYICHFPGCQKLLFLHFLRSSHRSLFQIKHTQFPYFNGFNSRSTWMPWCSLQNTRRS